MFLTHRLLASVQDQARVRHVSTHTHDAKALRPYRPVGQVGHRDYLDAEVGPLDTSPIDKPVGAPMGPQSVEWTGVEDYCLSGWYYKDAPFAATWHGCPVRSWLSGEVAQFRLHEIDPYPWRDRIRVALHHGEHDQVDCDIESLAYTYQAIQG